MMELLPGIKMVYPFLYELKLCYLRRLFAFLCLRGKNFMKEDVVVKRNKKICKVTPEKCLKRTKVVKESVFKETDFGLKRLWSSLTHLGGVI